MYIYTIHDIYIYVFTYRSIYVWSRGACVHALHIYIYTYQSIIDITMQREKTYILMYRIHRYIDASTKYMYMYTHTGKHTSKTSSTLCIIIGLMRVHFYISEHGADNTTMHKCIKIILQGCIQPRTACTHVYTCIVYISI